MLLLSAPLAMAQTWPVKQVRIISPFAPGGGHDAMARVLSGPLSEKFGTTVLVEAAELVEDGRVRRESLDVLKKGLPAAKIMIELPGPWISGVRACDIEEMKKILFAEFGPDVNMANIAITTIFDTEAQRVGLGTGSTVAFLLPAIAARGVDVTAEVTPHHLYFTDDVVESYDPVFKVNPPLRTASDVAAVREVKAP